MLPGLPQAPGRLSAAVVLSWAFFAAALYWPFVGIAKIVAASSAYAGKTTSLNLNLVVGITVAVTIGAPAAFFTFMAHRKARKQADELLRLRARNHALEQQVRDLLQIAKSPAGH